MYKIYRNCPKCKAMTARKEKGVFTCRKCGTQFTVSKDFKVEMKK